MNNLLQIFLGFFTADFIVGLFHWFEDSYLDFCNELPILSYIAKGNSLHHYYPRSILYYSYIEQLTVTLPLTLLVFFILYLLIPRKTLYKYRVFLFTFFLMSVVSNLIHRLCHMRDCEAPLFVRCLQKMYIIQSHTHHSMHHEDSESKYCVISPFLNYVLDYLLFWRLIENVIFLITGVKPLHVKYDYYESIHTNIHKESETECPKIITENDLDLLRNNLKNFYEKLK